MLATGFMLQGNPALEVIGVNAHWPLPPPSSDDYAHAQTHTCFKFNYDLLSMFLLGGGGGGWVGADWRV